MALRFHCKGEKSLTNNLQVIDFGKRFTYNGLKIYPEACLLAGMAAILVLLSPKMSSLLAGRFTFILQPGCCTDVGGFVNFSYERSSIM